MLAAFAIGIAACAADAPPPALAIGEIGYTEIELGALSARQVEDLAALAAFALTVSAGEEELFIEPLIERDRQSLLLQKLAAEVSLREAGYDDETLRSAYRQAPDHELVVRHLVILSERWRTDEERADARSRAEAALRRIRAGEEFAAVAAAVSDEPGADRRGGLLEPGRRGSWVPEFWAAASRLDVGEVSDVVETEYGFHVLRLEDRRVVPFDEVRDQVLDRLVDLAVVAERAQAWAERESSSLDVDAAAALEWRGGSAGDDVVLALWPGGDYRGAALRRYLLTLDRESADRIEAAGDSAFLGVVTGAARNAMLAEKAERSGIRIAAPESAAIVERWRERVAGWAATLGFRPGATPDAVEESALDALSATQQAAQIGRAELLKYSPALLAIYPVILPSAR